MRISDLPSITSSTPVFSSAAASLCFLLESALAMSDDLRPWYRTADWSAEL